MNIPERLLLIISGLLLFAPTGLAVDLIATVLIVAMTLIHIRRTNKIRISSSTKS